MDISRYFPLSNRVRIDESTVDSDRRAQIADLVWEAAHLVAARPDVADELSARFIGEARLTDAADAAPVDLTRLTTRVRVGRRKGARALVDAVRATILLAHRVDQQPIISGATLGAVALTLAGSAPFARRAVVSGHTIAAVDAGWEFGNGAILEGSALEIVEFLLGTSDQPPNARRAHQPDGPP